jgi:hypothetical protein
MRGGRRHAKQRHVGERHARVRCGRADRAEKSYQKGSSSARRRGLGPARRLEATEAYNMPEAATDIAFDQESGSNTD